MRRGPLAIGGAALLGLALIAYALFGWSNDEEAIEEQLNRLADAVRVEAGSQTNPIFKLGALKEAFAELFTPTVSVSGPDLPDSSALARGELAAFAAQASQRFNSADVSFGGISIQVLGDRAHVDAEVTLLATNAGGGGAQRDVRDVDFEFVKQDGDWLIEGVVLGPRQSGGIF